jgi:hypothetical protein
LFDQNEHHADSPAALAPPYKPPHNDPRPIVVDRRGTAKLPPPILRLPASPLPPDLFYAPGPMRAGSDREHERVAQFLKKHREYARMPHAAILQAAETFRDPVESTWRRQLADEGVPIGNRSDHEADEFGSDYA